MSTWIFENDNISPMEVQAFMQSVHQLFSAGRIPNHVRSIQRTPRSESGEMLVIELDSPAELVNDDDLVLAVLDEFIVSIAPEDEANAAVA